MSNWKYPRPDLTDRLDECAAMIQFETGDRVAASASLPSEASDRIKMLQIALERHDQFLVDNGYWDDFVGALPMSPKEEE